MLMDCQTRYGTVRGKMTDDGLVARYLGIPFGWIPGRWKRAQEPEPYSGVYDALHFGRIPFQGLHLEEMPHDRESPVPEDAMESETCLFLNIWAPVGASHSAVMVFVPGGGFINGATCQPVYDGEALARQGVVLVTVCHRLGALGFLSHPLLEDENGQSGNYALYDLLRALDWVHETISAFGGDPENVTLFGQSSGEVAVQVLLAAGKRKIQTRNSAKWALPGEWGFDGHAGERPLERRKFHEGYAGFNAAGDAGAEAQRYGCRALPAAESDVWAGWWAEQCAHGIGAEKPRKAAVPCGWRSHAGASGGGGAGRIDC